MKEATTPRASAEISSADRLVQALLDLWESHGNAAISVRTLAEAAELPVSSLYYHFGSMEQLSLAGQDWARAAAERWCEGHLDALPRSGDLPPEAFPPLLAALIDDWSQANRRLAFAWRECQLMAVRDARHLPALRAWQALWPPFWREVCARCGLPGFGDLSCSLFDGESLLHLMRWRRAIDRACLDEVCRGWGEWLAGRLVPEGPWRRFARTEALNTNPPPQARSEVAERIAAAAAEILAQAGVAGLTHRAVAARTGLTLGVVSYNFRTSADLLRAAFETTYRRAVSPPAQSGPPFIPGADLRRNIDVMIGLAAPPTPHILALDELFIAAARDPGLTPFAAQLRYLRGQTSGKFLQALVGADRPVSPLDAALLSSFSTGQWRACVGMTSDDARAFSRRGLESLLAALGRRLPA